ncbi:MAG: nickel pincer cofactor biosynthesis protein LarC [Deltaproteobacteria bacterium]|nr:nickel pincer cofactor biosynthesis protein LarC [Deltaproteobacteria bacterium]
MKILVFDPVGGASGDMILGSLVHLGCPLDYLKDSLNALNLGPFDIRVDFKKVHGIVTVDIGFIRGAHDEQRPYKDIKFLILGSKLEENIKERALKIFGCLAEAEASVHQVEMDEVHFHELGAIDSILDIVGISAAVEWFHADAVYATSIPLGSGMTETLHGKIPLPAPATIKLLEGMRVRFTGQEGELVTPTGAAVIKALARGPIHSDVIIKGTGYGCGDREFHGWPNLFRSILCEVSDVRDHVFIIETDVDDMVPEEWEAAIERVYEAGALDVSLETRIMKRGRPGSGLRVVAGAGKLEAIISAIFTHTTTIGVRYFPVMRAVLPRDEFLIRTRYGDVSVKEVILPDGTKRYKAQYRDIQNMSKKHGISVSRLRREIDEEIRTYASKRQEGGE